MRNKYSKPRRSEYWERFDKMLERTAEKGGRDYWTSLQDLAEAPDFQEYLKREFPDNAAQLDDPVGRRRFLKLMGASLALAGATACTVQPPEKILPYVRQPEQIVPGKPLYFATAMTLAGRAIGVLAESHMGRPVKLEGNEMHPASLGATDVYTQAAVLQLYDPDRSRIIRNAGRIRTWAVFADTLRKAIEEQAQKRGAGLRILSETVVSPSLADQLRRVLDDFPQARLHQYEPANRDSSFEATRMLFGRPMSVRYKFDQADVVLSLDADFLTQGDAPARYARDASKRRKAEAGEGMSRLYSAEANHTITGAYSDHRLALPPSQVEELARAAAQGVGAPGGAPWGDHEEFVEAVCDDLKRAGARALVLAGDQQPPVVHALAYLINHTLGSVGETVEFSEPIEAFPVNHTESLQELADAMKAGHVELLLMLGGNPVYDAPADLDFASALDNVPLRIHHSLYEDETSYLCHWHIPALHFLESWGDTRAYDGTVSIQQPIISPLYAGKSAYEMLAFFTGDEGFTTYEMVQGYWKRNSPAADFDSFWRGALHDGMVAGSSLPAQPATPNPDALPATPSSRGGGVEILFPPDPTVHDGRFANNGWLQECPKQLSKLTWDNALLVSPAAAAEMGGQIDEDPEGGSYKQWPANGQMVDLEFKGRTLRVPVWVVPGHADGCATLYLGSGRTRAGRVGDGCGFNAYKLRTTDAMGFGAGAEVRPAGEYHPLACVQDHHRLEGRGHYRAATLSTFRDDPEFVDRYEHLSPEERANTLYPEFSYENEYKWGMSINLNACTGCNACVVACQAENNIPVVGKDQVLRGREMHWLRVDRYFKGSAQAPAAFNQPVPCMQCENAPCEPVCPVAATVHSNEGLNDMIYNRCVGTRYCANNCPYKVRRFNFYLYADWDTPSRKLQYNPDVTVRSRGVMEKCTYCVQRISLARIEAKREDRSIRDGEVKTACQQVCPTEAILFGDLNDPEARVSRAKASPLNYAMLAELGTRPRTSYLARVVNPHEGLGTPVDAPEEEEGH